MLQIGEAIVSLDVLEKRFCCDLQACRGACCIEGDSGAPLEEEEGALLQEHYPAIAPFMKAEGLQAVAGQGYAVVDSDGDLVTPLIDGKECAYAIEENGSCWCAIEKAWFAGKVSFRKPVSCHLYPIRITRYQQYEAVNYNQWHVCRGGRCRGEREDVPLYRFLKEPLIRKYGEEWYEQLCYAAEEVKNWNRTQR